MEQRDVGSGPACDQGDEGAKVGEWQEWLIVVGKGGCRVEFEVARNGSHDARRVEIDDGVNGNDE